MSYIQPESWEMLDLFHLYRDFRQFPFPGTVLEQPAEMIDAFRIFEAELAAVRGPERPLTATELVEILASAFGAKK